MTRVLHLLMAEGPLPDACLCALVADVTRHEQGQHHILLLGGEGLRDAADQAGLAPYTLLPEPAGLSLLTLPLHRRMRRLLDTSDRVEAWTRNAARLARRAGGPPIQPRYRQKHRLAMAEHHGDTGRLDHADRAALRAHWGVADDAYVLALLGRSSNSHDTATAMMTMQMARGVLDFREGPQRQFVLLCHPMQPDRHEASTALYLSDHGDTLIQEPRLAAPWQALPGCDAALWPCGSADPPLAVWWAKQAELPILTCDTGEPRELADAVARWMADEPVAPPDWDRMIPSA